MNMQISQSPSRPQGRGRLHCSFQCWPSKGPTNQGPKILPAGGPKPKAGCPQTMLPHNRMSASFSHPPPLSFLRDGTQGLMRARQALALLNYRRLPLFFETWCPADHELLLSASVSEELTGGPVIPCLALSSLWLRSSCLCLCLCPLSPFRLLVMGFSLSE